jgi:hypothetical protein
MLAVIARLAEDFPAFASDLIASRDSLYRICRDTRFRETSVIPPCPGIRSLR